MSIIKEKIKFNGLDTNIIINLGIGNRHSGYQQEINSFTEETKVNLINPVIDNEVSKFEYDSDSLNATNLSFEFTPNGSTYANSFTTNGAGFSPTEISSRDIKILNSFFIMDFFDTFDNNTQTKIFTIYNTKILNGEKSGSTPIPKYEIYSNTINQFYCWYVPKSFIDTQTGSTATGYVRFSFYNAKTGKIILFNNKDIANPLSPDKMYFKAYLNLNTMKWGFNYISTLTTPLFPPNAVARQIPSTSAYAQRVNNAVNNFNNEQQNYPEGNIFDISNGTYITE
jgi:hypothetical protein